MSEALNLSMPAVARRQLHVILALDTSGSMSGDRIASLNYALRTAVPELRDVAADNPEVDVRIRVLRFGTEVRWVVEEPVPVAELRWESLVAEGETNMGRALEMIGEKLAAAQMPGRQLPPVVVLASDGYPSDDIDAGLQRFFAADHARAAVRVAIAIGSDADLEILERFIDHPAMKPLRANNANALVQHIKWATTAPVKAVSSPTNASDLVKQLGQSADAKVDINSEIIW